MEKSFSEILTESFAVFKKSIPFFLKILGVCIGGVGLSIIAILLTLGTPFIKNIDNSAYVQNYLSSTSGTTGLFITIIFFFLFVLSYVCYCSTILVVRNHVMGKEDSLKALFIESLRKFWKVFLTWVIIVVLLLILMSAEMALPFVIFTTKHAALALIVAIPLIFITILAILPPCFTVFYGILCSEGRFLTVLKESTRLGFQKWLKIVIYTVLIMLICSLPLGMIMGSLFYVFQMVNMMILGNVLSFVLQIIIGIFSACFFTVFYLDISGTTAKEDLPVPTMPQ